MRGLKGTRIVFLIMSALLVIAIIVGYNCANQLSLYQDSEGYLFVKTDKEWENTKAWEDNGIYYFFLPSHIKNSHVLYNDGKLILNEEVASVRGVKIPWNNVCELKLQDLNGEISWMGKVCFMKSANIPSLHVTMNDDDLEVVNSDKQAKRAAEITLVEANGNINYQGRLEYITGRGNTTWLLDKKTYTMKLQNEYPLLDMDLGKKWVLLANGYEGSKIMYKMTMDIAAQMGMGYVPEMTWIDLYINGAYQGNYLLAEKIAVGDGNVEIENLNIPNEIARGDEEPTLFVDNYFKGYETENNPENITGGYLIEKDFLPYYGEETCGFFTNRLQPFTIKHPSMATRAEAEYITNFVKVIDDLMAAKDEQVLQFIDEKSFYQKYILDEVSLNSDSNVTSAYFYKHKDENTLYAGPPWDYDGVYGESGGVWTDYSQSVLDVNALRGSDSLALDWYNVLYSFEDCRKEIIEEYEKVLPIYQYYLESGIDDYKEVIYDSVQMDMMRWNYGANQAGSYEEYDNTIRYLKYFMTNRLNCLNERWGISCDMVFPETTKEIHEVCVDIDGEVTTLHITDGTCILMEQLPRLPEQYKGYEYKRDGREFSPFLPVYENQYIIAVQKED